MPERVDARARGSGRRPPRRGHGRRSGWRGRGRCRRRGEVVGEVGWAVVAGPVGSGVVARLVASVCARVGEDRKGTRLNSSHANISYAVFCLKKKKHLV